MSSLIDCPSCQRKLRVPEEFLGKSVRCPTCGETFRAPESAGAAAPPPTPAPAPTAANPSPIVPVPLKLELDDSPAPAAAPSEEPRPRPGDAPPRRKREPDEDEDESRGERRRRRRRDFEPCPGCGGDIRRGAVVCPYCGLDLEVQGDGFTRQQPVRRDAEPHRGSTVQGLGIASLVLAAFYVFPVGLPLGLAAWIMGRRDLKKMDEGTMDPNGRKKTRDGWLCGLIGTLLNCLWGFGCVGFVAMMVAAGAAAVPPPVAPAAPPPMGKRGGPPQVNNFTLTGPPGAVLVKRNAKQSFAVAVNRVAGFRGDVTLTVDQDPDDLETDPPVAVARLGMRSVTFTVTADDDAELEEKVVRLRGTSDAGDEVILDVRVRVVR
jgi:predicted Zn finger-like uncharacterized protein